MLLSIQRAWACRKAIFLASRIRSAQFAIRLPTLSGQRRTPDAHSGDFAASKGTPVVVATSGTVRLIGFKSGYGNIVVLTHDGRHVRTIRGIAPRYSVGSMASNAESTPPPAGKPDSSST
ncbi:M23 family metallopeptidase [Paraburkholderia sp. UYCP14C]|uniref:M23 family metallopeptidase n=1 Tax=Paraburkholderia sp. UYCP14C TaxID=2511130 RepID=UPI0035A14303